MLATSLSCCCKKPARRPQFWTIGLPAVLLVSAALGFLARRRDWLWTFAIVPAQVTTMTVVSGEIGSLSASRIAREAC